MAERYTPDPVLPVGAVMVTPEISLHSVMKIMEEYFGAGVVHSKGFLVRDFTDYYVREMGEETVKYFYYVESLYPLKGAEAWKIWSNDLEKEFRNSAGVNRPVNMDPGYLTQAKLVLFSMKGYAHRIYIRDGVYGEVTLQYRGGAFHSLPWTYSDYQTPMALEFWKEAREKLRQLITD